MILSTKVEVILSQETHFRKVPKKAAVKIQSIFRAKVILLLGVKGNEPNLKQTIYSSFLIWLTDSSSGISSTMKTEFGQKHSVPK